MSFPSLLRAVSTRPFVRIIGLLCLLLGLGGCSAIKLGYNALPEVAYWWLDGFVDFDDGQRQPVRDDIARVHAWHRTEELPRYVAVLQQVERLAATGFTPAQACALEPALRERAVVLLRGIEPYATAHALTLQPQQIQRIRRKYEERNREYQKEWVRLDRDELLEKREKEIVKRADTIYGAVNDRQLAVLRDHLRASAFSPAMALKERQRRQQDTLAVLQRVSSHGVALGDARAAVRGLLDRYLASPEPAYRAYVDTLRLETCRLIAALHEAATPEQRDTAVRRLRGWQRAFGELSSAG
jgi:hypothetical protein